MSQLGLRLVFACSFVTPHIISILVILSSESQNKKAQMIESLQKCIIPGTISIHDEVTLLNEQLNKDKTVSIVVYGKNHNDEKIISKYQQLTSLGFSNIFIYPGGIFEWLLLQEIYGDDNFPTTIKEIDILKYR